MHAVLISGGNVIDGTGSQPQPNTDVLIEGDRIVAVGKNLVVEKSSEREVRRIDATGLTVMPGLIDAHTHITLGEPRTNDELFLHRDPATAAILAAYNVRKFCEPALLQCLMSMASSTSGRHFAIQLMLASLKAQQ